MPPFAQRKVGYAALQRLQVASPVPSLQEPPAGALGGVKGAGRSGGSCLLCGSGPGLENALNPGSAGGREQEPEKGFRAVGQQRAALLARPFQPDSCFPRVLGRPFPAPLLPCCISPASPLPLLLRASVSPKTTVSVSGC